MPSELLKLVELIHKEKDIDPEVLFQGIESAIQSAAKKKYRDSYDREHSDIHVSLDRKTGDISFTDQNGNRFTPSDLGRIAAQAGKQAILQKIREAERDVLYTEFIRKKHTIITGRVDHFENRAVILDLGKAEGVIPLSEQIPSENYTVNSQIKAYLLDVKRERSGSPMKIILSRSNPDFIRKLFELRVPEIEDGIIEINQLVREPGYRTKIAVSSQDPKVDCVGACVGHKGERILNIIAEASGEKIDIIRWDNDPITLIQNALKPATVSSITLDHEQKKATVQVNEGQQSLAIGKDGQNVRLAMKLSQWDIDIVSIPTPTDMINE